jgi:hypothetical protein
MCIFIKYKTCNIRKFIRNHLKIDKMKIQNINSGWV